MKRNIIKVIFIFSCFSSCLNENKIIIETDFESPARDWSIDSLCKGKAHSGDFFVRSDSINIYTPSFSKDISSISSSKIVRIDLIAWIRKSDEHAKADLVVSLDRNDVPVFWKGFSTQASAPELNEWVRMYVSYDLPDTVGRNENLKVYFWNNNKLPIDIDDMEIRLYY